MKRFEEKTVLITGASRGIGAATARRFASEGANLVLVARDPAWLAEVADAVGKETNVLAIPADVTDDAAVDSLLERTIEQFGALHVLVNNAGFNHRGPVESVPPEELRRIVDVNLAAPISLTRRVLPHLRRVPHGAIVNVAGIAGKIPVPGIATYSATKFGLRAFTYALAEELRGSNVSVSVVSPGPIDTGFIMSDLDAVPDVVFSAPLRTSDDVASLIVKSAVDGAVERCTPRRTGYLSTVGYLFPTLARWIRPLLARKGARAKARIRKRLAG